jgi:putative phosphoesterase
VLIGIVSDIHCNVAAMEHAVDALSGMVDTVVVAGDAVFEYRFSNEIIELIRAHELPYVLGNHELTLLGPAGERARSASWIHPENMEFMASAPKRLTLDPGGKRITVVHASPFAPYNDYLHAGSHQLARCASLDTDFLVLGHTHRPMAERIGSVLVVNPGSLGQADDPTHPGLLSYAVLDSDSDEVTIHRFEAARPA